MSPTEREELDQMLRDLEFRTSVTGAMLATLDLEQILYMILSGITSGDGLSFNRAFLFLDDQSGRHLRINMALGPATEADAHRIWAQIDRDKLTFPELLQRYEAYRADSSEQQELAKRLSGLLLPLNELQVLALPQERLLVERRAPLSRVLARCLLNRSPFSSNVLTLTHEATSGEVMEFCRVAVVPLTVAGRLIGAVLADNIYSGSPVSDRKLSRMHALCNLAALAIDRARLHAQTVAMAEVDGLTGVYNRRYYQQELARRLETARRTGQVLSIVVFDLDHFKQVNDSHGHLVGDELLREVARLITGHLRQSDKVARYGGEEFVLLLADTGAEAARQVAEKLRQVVKTTPMADGRVTGLTLSAGVAVTGGWDSPEELFERADRALYDAKEHGRDQVVVWNS
jgi:diguanylate cyclase (GGDEF)-like protein